MTTTWQIQTQIFPKAYLERKADFFLGCLDIGNEFICDFFNNEFKKAYINGKTDKLIVYKSKEFQIINIFTERAERMMVIKVPEPKPSEFSYEFHTKCYFVPYVLNDNSIDVLDLYSVEKIKGTDSGFIVFYKDGEHLIFNKSISHNIDNCDYLINVMYKHIFLR